MKFVHQYLFSLVIGLLSLAATSCLDKEEELYDVVGPVAAIPVFTASKTAPQVGETITLSLRYYSPNVAVKELRLNETIGNGEKKQIASKTITNFDTQNSYVDTFEYTVPANATGSKITFEVVAVTTNDLARARTLTITVP